MTSSSRCLNRNQSRAKVSLSIEYIFLLLFVPQKSQMLARLTLLFRTIVASVVTPNAANIYVLIIFPSPFVSANFVACPRRIRNDWAGLHRLVYLQLR